MAVCSIPLEPQLFIEGSIPPTSYNVVSKHQKYRGKITIGLNFTPDPMVLSLITVCCFFSISSFSLSLLIIFPFSHHKIKFLFVDMEYKGTTAFYVACAHVEQFILNKTQLYIICSLLI